MQTPETDLFVVAPPPHLKHTDTTRGVMLDVLIALLPATLWAVYLFGARALLLVFLGVGSAVGFEALFAWVRKKPVPVRDGSAAVSGLLLSLCLPVTVPLWMPVLGSAFAMVIVKGLYGGIGKNILNPALAARVFLFLSFPQMMATSAAPRTEVAVFVFGQADAVTSATPLAAPQSVTLSDLFFGLCGGAMGEVSTLLLLAGGVYLLVRRVITWHIPVSYLAVVAVYAFCFPASGGRWLSVGYELCAGGLMLGALFMATDYATSPLSGRARLVYGAGCGLLTMLLRSFSTYPEGVSFAILVMNLLVWYLDAAFRPRPFGGHQARGEARR